MKLSTKGRYGLTAMLYLARHTDDGPMSLRSMAETGIFSTAKRSADDGGASFPQAKRTGAAS